MLPLYELQICSTGETVLSEYSEDKMWVWQNKVEKQLLKDGRRASSVKEAIKAKDTIVGWANFDEFTFEEMLAVCSHVFDGYDLYFEKRIPNER